MTNDKLLLLAVLTWAGASSYAVAACPSPLLNNTTANAVAVMDWFDCKASLGGALFTGNVGIGAASAPQRLVVESATGGYVATIQSNSDSPGFMQMIRGANSSKMLDFTYGLTHIDAGALRGFLGGNVLFQLDAGGPSFLNGGNLGVGTSTPYYRLDATGSGPMLRLISTSNYSEIALSNSSHYSYIGDYPNGLNFFSNHGGNPTMVLSPGGPGNVGIGTSSPAQRLDVAGTIRQSGCTTAGTLSVNGDGDIICSSDARLKNVLGDYVGGLDALMQVRPKRFVYKTRGVRGETFVHAGFIAQNVRSVIPEASARQKDGYYSLDLAAVLATSVNAIKQLKQQNDRQSAEIMRLTARVRTLEADRLIRLGEHAESIVRRQ